MILPAGEYVIENAYVSEDYPFPLDDAAAILPLLIRTKSIAGQISYIGNIKVDIRERKDDESRCIYTPLPVQLVLAGFYGGTFDVVIRDSFDLDMSYYKTNFPVLENAIITKLLPSKYDKEKAENWALEKYRDPFLSYDGS